MIKDNMRQFGVITYPKTGDVRSFVAAYAPAGCYIRYCAGYAELWQ